MQVMALWFYHTIIRAFVDWGPKLPMVIIIIIIIIMQMHECMQVHEDICIE